MSEFEFDFAHPDAIDSPEEASSMMAWVSKQGPVGPSVRLVIVQMEERKHEGL